MFSAEKKNGDDDEVQDILHCMPTDETWSTSLCIWPHVFYYPHSHAPNSFDWIFELMMKSKKNKKTKLIEYKIKYWVLIFICRRSSWGNAAGPGSSTGRGRRGRGRTWGRAVRRTACDTIAAALMEELSCILYILSLVNIVNICVIYSVDKWNNRLHLLTSRAETPCQALVTKYLQHAQWWSWLSRLILQLTAHGTRTSQDPYTAQLTYTTI